MRWYEVGTFRFCQRRSIVIGMEQVCHFSSQRRAGRRKSSSTNWRRKSFRRRVLHGLILETHGLLNGFQLTLGDKLGPLADRFRELANSSPTTTR